MTSLDPLGSLDGLSQKRFNSTDCHVHKDHRWILPLILFAQQNGSLPIPTTLVGFDAHHDALTPVKMTAVRQSLEGGLTIERLLDLCSRDLATIDDDWLIAGMELGLLDNAVIFGVEDRGGFGMINEHIDASGVSHKFAILDLPRAELAYQGNLSDNAREEELGGIWSLLDWEMISGIGFEFKADARKILLDFDLDCFVVRWNDYKFPWPDEVFEREFLSQTEYEVTRRWTGRTFLDNLKGRAGLITIAREPNHCGGDAKASTIFGKVNQYLFDSRIQ